jgi:polysaccharide chain length determinant protein (PEP-CTERM system associated)
MDNSEISKYINIAIKRKWWIIITFLVSLLGGFTYMMVTPRIYEAQTLILIQGQRVPEEYVRPVVSSSVDDKLNTIFQQVTSRTNSEKIINEFGLYSTKSDMLIEKKVELFISRINIDIAKDTSRRNAETSAFTISFQDEDPKKVMDVTNALARNYMDEHLKMREDEALGTSAFLSDELKSIETQLKEKEAERQKYREKYMGGLPEQLQTNLKILEGLREQLDQYNSNLRDAENRKAGIIRDIALASETGSVISDSPQRKRPGEVNDLASLKKELEVLQSRYTLNHPDVIRLKETIARLEKEKTKTKEEADGSTDEELTGIGAVDQAMRKQLEDVNLNIANLKAEIEETRSQITYYQKMVEDTPKREQELVELNRDYEILTETYNSYRNKQIDAGIAVSLEKMQKGEQFKILDYAKIPERPVKPDVKKILLITLVLGLGLGCGIAYLFETMDTSYSAPDEVEDDLGLPVLASIPLLVTEKELQARKRREIFTGISVSLGFLIALFGIFITVKGFNSTIDYIKGMFGG